MTVCVVKPVAVDRLLVRHLSDAHTQIVNAACLKRVRDAPPAAARQLPIEQHSSKVWTCAREEERLIAPLLEHFSPQERARVAGALGLSDRQVRRKLRRFEVLRSVEAFLPFRGGPLHGSTQVHPEVEIRDALKVSPDIGVDDCCRSLRQRPRLWNCGHQAGARSADDCESHAGTLRFYPHHYDVSSQSKSTKRLLDTPGLLVALGARSTIDYLSGLFFRIEHTTLACTVFQEAIPQRDAS